MCADLVRGRLEAHREGVRARREDCCAQRPVSPENLNGLAPVPVQPRIPPGIVYLAEYRQSVLRCVVGVGEFVGGVSGQRNRFLDSGFAFARNDRLFVISNERFLVISTERSERRNLIK